MAKNRKKFNKYNLNANRKFRRRGRYGAIKPKDLNRSRNGITPGPDPGHTEWTEPDVSENEFGTGDFYVGPDTEGWGEGGAGEPGTCRCQWIPGPTWPLPMDDGECGLHQTDSDPCCQIQEYTDYCEAFNNSAELALMCPETTIWQCGETPWGTGTGGEGGWDCTCVWDGVFGYPWTNGTCNAHSPSGAQCCWIVGQSFCNGFTTYGDPNNSYWIGDPTINGGMGYECPTGYNFNCDDGPSYG